MEHWLPVVGFEGWYEISDQARVRFVDRVVLTCSGGTRRIRSKVLRPSAAGMYLSVNLYRGPGVKPVTRSVHLLVLEAFVGPCPPGLEALHGIGGAHDNRPVNLAWGTKAQNEADKVRDGTSNRGRSALLTAADVVAIRASGAPGVELAIRYGVSQQAICDIRKRRNWRHVP